MSGPINEAICKEIKRGHKDMKLKKLPKEWIKDPLTSFLSFGFLLLKGPKGVLFPSFSFLWVIPKEGKGRKRKCPLS